MIKNLIYFIIACLIFSCTSSNNNTYKLKVKIKGLKEGVFTYKSGVLDKNIQSVKLKNGEFEIEHKAFKEPTKIYFSLKEHFANFHVFVKNEVNIVEAEFIKKTSEMGINTYLDNIKIEGCEVNKQEKEYNILKTKTHKQWSFSRSSKFKDINEFNEKREKAFLEMNLNYIKNNSSLFYASIIAKNLIDGLDAKGVRKILSLLDLKLNNSNIKFIKEKLIHLSKNDVSISKFIKAENIKYKVDKSFVSEKIRGILYLGILNNFNLCVLDNTNKIHIISKKGKTISTFKIPTKNNATSFAIDKNNKIYVLTPFSQEVIKKIRGKKIKVNETKYFQCHILDTNGKLLSKFNLAENKSASGARVLGDQLLVADNQKRKILLYNKNSGKLNTTMDNMRPCCGILDFSISNKNQIYVANLGAFRVKVFDLSGKNLMSFGKRGRGINDFHGCCNPVSLACLSNGAIKKKKKNPTRVKVYSKNGAKQIKGIQELVQGCSYIPMIVDNNDNLFLSSSRNGIIKCVAIK